MIAAASPTSSAGPLPALSVLRVLFERLQEAGIRYCHWKSNEHLAAAMTGATDVDVLIERQSAQRLAHVLTETSDFKRFVVKAGRGYPGIEDYVGFDRATGTLTHLHLHYQLTLGEKFLKGRRLPWETLMLDTRVLDPDYGVYVADPQLELLILVVRAAIKLRWRDYPLAMFGRRYFGGSMLRELRWLSRRVKPEELVAVATPLVGAASAQLLQSMVSDSGPSIGQLLRFGRSARPRLSTYRLYSALDTTRRMWVRESTWIWWRGKHVVLRAPTKSTRSLPYGGVAIALVGPAPREMAALIRNCADWLAREVAVVLISDGGSESRRRSVGVRRACGLGMVALSNGLSPGDAIDVVIRVRNPLQEAAVQELPAGARVIEVNATGPHERVLLQTKQAIWQCL